MSPSIAAGAASSSLLGREQELSLLTSLLRDLERGTGTAVLIEGEPGIGKSTLVGVLVTDAVAPQSLNVTPQVFRGTGDELGQELPLLPFLDALKVRMPGASARRNAIAAAFEEKTGKAKEKHDRIVALAKARFDRALEGCECEITEMEQKLVLHGQRLLSDMNAALEEEAPDPDDFDWPEPAEADEWEDDPLYDSTRDYVAQVDRFRAHQGKDCNVRLFRDQPLTRDCTECKKPFQSTNPNQTACGTVCANKRAYRVRVERSRHTKNSMSILPEAR